MSQLQVTGEAKIRDIQGPVVANSGVVTALDGAASQYVRGDGTLADFPTSTGGGSSVSYYLNGSVNQGNIGGTLYYQMSKTPVIGAGTDFTISTNGLLAAFITDANDPALLEVPGGNFNCEFFFSVNSNSHNPFVYAELYKVNGSTFTLLGSSVSVPEYLNNGTTISPYYFAIPVATAALTATDRIAIRIFADVDGRTVTLHTENSHLCQIVTTFSKGLTTLNNLTKQVQYFAVGTSGSDFNIVSSSDTHTFNIPSADASNRGLVTTGTQSFGGNKSFGGTTTAANLNVSGVLTVFGNLSNGTFSYTLPSAAGQLALTSQIPTITGASYIVSRFNLAGTSLENSSISDTGTYTGSPTGQVTMNSRLTVNNYAEVNRYLSIAQNVDSSWALPSSGTNLEAFITSASGGILVSDTGYLRPRKSSDDTFKRFIIQGDELILNDTTSRKTLINKAGPTQTTTKLEVAGYARFDNSINVNGVLYLNATDASQPTYIQAPSGNLSIVTSGTTFVNSTGSILLTSNNNPSIFIATTGLVGINGATPSEALTVNGGGLFTSPLLVTTNDNNFAFNVQLKNTNAGTQALTGLGLSDLAGTRKGQILWIPSNYITTSLQNSFLVSSVTNIPLILCADATGAATPNIIFQSGATNKMLLNGTSGNFSIGNTNNTYKLDVSGTARFTDALTGTSATFSSSVTSATKFISSVGNNNIVFESLSATTGFVYMQLLNNTAHTIFGIEGTAAGSLLTGGLAYGSVFTSVGNTALQLGTNQIARLTITNAGNVGIGTTTPQGALEVVGLSYFTRSSQSTLFNPNYGGANTHAQLQVIGNMALAFATNGDNERMRITSGGEVLINTSSVYSANYTFQIATKSAGGILIRDVSGNGVFQLFQTSAGTNIGSITHNGLVTSFNTTSDYRLKQDLKDYSGLDLVSAIKTYDYEWKSDKSRMYGVMAHELKEVIPYAVLGEKDAEQMQQVDYSKIVPILVKAIQELEARIKQLENKNK
jgi:hypothetical protein